MTDKDKELRNHSWDELFEFLGELRTQYPDPEKSKLIYVLTKDGLDNIKKEAEQRGRQEAIEEAIQEVRYIGMFLDKVPLSTMDENITFRVHHCISNLDRLSSAGLCPKGKEVVKEKQE